MCLNEECIYPFNEKDMMKDSFYEDRTRSSDGTLRKRRLQGTKVLPKTIEPATATSTSAPTTTLTTTSIKKVTRKDMTTSQPLKRRRLSTAVATATTSSSSTSATTQAIISAQPSVPSSTTTSSASAESLLELLMGDAPSNSIQPPIAAVPVRQQPSTLDAGGHSPGSVMPDLTFDFLPAATWTTPVTPPNDNHHETDRSSMLSFSKKSGIDIASSNIADLLFDSKFDMMEMDFGSLENCADLEFDADLDAILQQHM
ncbi:hypothetical protein BGZ83_002957 [Gryganskiella cystojenkinii]|nr:hypothetical protein BGZ83_002957 [Gryganskiella cystojenkinii]